MTNELPARDREKNIRLYRICVDRAQEKLGKDVFLFQQPVIQKALISAEILALVNEQDETVGDDRVREIAQVLQEILETW